MDKVRFSEEVLVREALIGYHGDDEDDPALPEEITTLPWNSDGIKKLVREWGREKVPIFKQVRINYVWVVSTNSSNDRERYTLDKDEIASIEPFKDKELNRCDLTGRVCKLYRARCYARDQGVGVEKRLDPFIAYVSEASAQGLLGKPSAATKRRVEIAKEIENFIRAAPAWTPEDCASKFKQLIEYGQSHGWLQLLLQELSRRAGGRSFSSGSGSASTPGGGRSPEGGVSSTQPGKGNSSTSSGVALGVQRAEDAKISIPDAITLEYVQELLMQQTTWPKCTSRQNVLPEGKPDILAFPLGLVKPYYTRDLVPGVHTKGRPNLTKVIAKLAQEILSKDSGFRWSTAQLNKDYSARLHVDGNNVGPSFIIAFGEYEGGELWYLDMTCTKGDPDYHEVKLTEKMKHWPHLQIGQILPGRKVSIKGQWHRFDGNVPHMALPHTGHRVSIVYFTRSGAQHVSEKDAEFLRQLGIDVPDENYITNASTKGVKVQVPVAGLAPADVSSDAAKPAPSTAPSDVQEILDSDSDSDVDEMEEEYQRATAFEHSAANQEQKQAVNLLEQLKVAMDSSPRKTQQDSAEGVTLEKQQLNMLTSLRQVLSGLGEETRETIRQLAVDPGKMPTTQQVDLQQQNEEQMSTLAENANTLDLAKYLEQAVEIVLQSEQQRSEKRWRVFFMKALARMMKIRLPQEQRDLFLPALKKLRKRPLSYFEATNIYGDWIALELFELIADSDISSEKDERFLQQASELRDIASHTFLSKRKEVLQKLQQKPLLLERLLHPLLQKWRSESDKQFLCAQHQDELKCVTGALETMKKRWKNGLPQQGGLHTVAHLGRTVLELASCCKEDKHLKQRSADFFQICLREVASKFQSCDFPAIHEIANVVREIREPQLQLDALPKLIEGLPRGVTLKDMATWHSSQIAQQVKAFKSAIDAASLRDPVNAAASDVLKKMRELGQNIFEKEAEQQRLQKEEDRKKAEEEAAGKRRQELEKKKAEAEAAAVAAAQKRKQERQEFERILRRRLNDGSDTNFSDKWSTELHGDLKKLKTMTQDDAAQDDSELHSLGKQAREKHTEYQLNDGKWNAVKVALIENNFGHVLDACGTSLLNALQTDTILKTLSNKGLTPKRASACADLARHAFNSEPPLAEGWFREWHPQSELQIFLPASRNTFQWKFPEQTPKKPEVPQEPQEAVGMGTSVPGRAVYIETSPTGGNPRCLLCDRESQGNHFNGNGHKKTSSQWWQLVKIFEQASQTLVWATPDLLRMELLYLLREAPQVKEHIPEYIQDLFWMRIVKPVLAQTATSDVAFKLAVAAAKFAEPTENELWPEPTQSNARVEEVKEQVEEVRDEIPLPGKDIPFCPPLSEKASTITPHSPEDVISTLSLSDEDLWNLGMQSVSADGSEVEKPSLYCRYCEKVFSKDELSRHLHPHFNSGKQHYGTREQTLNYIEQFKVDGYKLKYEGVSIAQYKYHCRICDATGPWYECFQKHVDPVGKRAAHTWAKKNSNIRLPARPEKLGAEEKRVWEEFFERCTATPGTINQARAHPEKKRKLVQDSSSSTSSQPLQFQAKKRQMELKPEETDSNQKGKPFVSPKPKSHSKKPSIPVIVPAGTKFDPPKLPQDEEWVKEEIEKRHFHVDPPDPELVYAWFTATSRNLSIWCKSCNSWVGWVKLKSKEVDPDGQCPHWNPEAKALLKSKLASC